MDTRRAIQNLKRPSLMVATGLAVCLLLGVVGLFRAIADFGHAGVVAFLKVLCAPAILAVWWLFLIVPRHESGRLGGFLPSDATWIKAGYFVIAMTAIALAAVGVLGVGWLVRK
jgi:hypothetical protein